MKPHKTEYERRHERFMEDVEPITADLKHYGIAEFVDCKMPDFDWGKKDYMELRFRKVHNLDLFEAILRSINRQALDAGSGIAARLIDLSGEGEEENEEYVVVFVPYSSTERNVWMEATKKFTHSFRKGLKNFERMAGFR